MRVFPLDTGTEIQIPLFIIWSPLGKVIQVNQLDATMIYWSIRSAQHVSGNILPIIRSVRLWYLQHMVSSCCGGQGVGERQPGTICTVRRELLDLFLQVVCRWGQWQTEEGGFVPQRTARVWVDLLGGGFEWSTVHRVLTRLCRWGLILWVNYCVLLVKMWNEY